MEFDNALHDDLFYFNGINGDTGDYNLQPMSAARLFDVLHSVDKQENIQELRYRVQWENQTHLGVVEAIDPSKIEEAGWGVIFPADPENKFVPAIKDALKPLLDLRREQAGDLFRMYEGVDALRPGESKTDFLVRHGVPPADPANPQKMPYYLLLVGDPSQIPYRFQSQLDVQYAVGRIHFETLQEYANYAASVVAAETGKVSLPKKAAFFSVMNADDRATELSTTKLMEPLLTQMGPEHQDWSFAAHMRDGAKKAQLASLLGGDETPALLFTAGHGVPFSLGSSRQLAHQGALLCQDWPGPKEWRSRGEISQDHYFAGDDLTSDANLLGMVAFFFACYGGGTPKHDDFPKPGTSTLNQVAPDPFVARLPMRMLGREKGGALAVIAHVERAWGASFVWSRNIEQTDVFKSTLTHIMDGKPVGSALEYFNSRYATWASELSTTWHEEAFGLMVEPKDIASLWMAHNDARSCAIIGDPAVRLPLTGDDTNKDGQFSHNAKLRLAEVNHGIAWPSTETHSVSEAYIPVTASPAATEVESLGKSGTKVGKQAQQISMMPSKSSSFTNQQLIDVFFFAAHKFGLTGEELMSKAGLDLNQLAVNEATRYAMYAGPSLAELSNLALGQRALIMAKLSQDVRLAQHRNEHSNIINELKSENQLAAKVTPHKGANLSQQTSEDSLSTQIGTVTVTTLRAEQPTDAEQELFAQTQIVAGNKVVTTVFGTELNTREIMLELHKSITIQALNEVLSK